MDSKITRTTGFNKWLIFIGAYVVMTVNDGFLWSLGKLFVIILDTFNDTRAATATVQSVAYGVVQASGILTGAFVHKFGPRNASLLGSTLIFIGLSTSFFAASVVYLVFSIGICFAIGASLIFISSTTVVGEHFDGKSSVVALSVLSTSTGVGGMIYPYLIDLLNEHYSLRGTLLIIGGLTSNGLASSLLYESINTHQDQPAMDKRVTHSNGLNTVSSNTDNSLEGTTKKFKIDDNKTVEQVTTIKLSNKDTIDIISSADNTQEPEDIKSNTIFESMKVLFRNKCFILFCFGMAFTGAARNYYTIFFVDIFIDNGLTISDASFGLVLFNICNIFGRLCNGFITQLPRISTLTVPILASCVGIFAMLLHLYEDSYIITILCASILGIITGMFRSGFTVTTASIVGKIHLSNGIGILTTLNCFTNLAFGPIGGWLRDTTGSYSVVFIAAAVMFGVGLLMFIPAQYFRSHGTNRRRKYVLHTTKL